MAALSSRENKVLFNLGKKINEREGKKNIK